MSTYKHQYAANAERLIWRALNSTLLIKRSKVKATGGLIMLAAETPIEHEAYGRCLLLMVGLTLRPHARNSIPLVIEDGSVRGVVGSFRDCKINERMLHAKPVFATDDDAQTIARRWQEGYLADAKIEMDFQVSEGLEIGASDEYDGWQGPLLVGVKWSPVAVRLRP